MSDTSGSYTGKRIENQVTLNLPISVCFDLEAKSNNDSPSEYIFMKEGAVGIVCG
jgi:hypothetical protein